jgi:hypothetical protein
MRALLKVHTLLKEERFVTHEAFLELVFEALFMLVERPEELKLCAFSVVHGSRSLCFYNTRVYLTQTRGVM